MLEQTQTHTHHSSQAKKEGLKTGAYIELYILNSSVAAQNQGLRLEFTEDYLQKKYHSHNNPSFAAPVTILGDNLQQVLDLLFSITVTLLVLETHNIPVATLSTRLLIAHVRVSGPS